VNSEEYPDAHLRHNSGQRNVETEELLPGSDEIMSSHGSLMAAKQTVPDLLPPWQSPFQLIPQFSSTLETGPRKRSGLDDWQPVGPSQLSNGHRSRPQSVFRSNRGAFAKRQMILYRQCFFNPISCFHK
ncbi:unnamed protein product, partial [Allacma fusca]